MDGDGDGVVAVDMGIHFENIRFGGKNITLRSMNPTDWDSVQDTIIQGVQVGPVVTFSGTEDASCVLSGFTIRNARAGFGDRVIESPQPSPTVGESGEADSSNPHR
jgi:hypothetical protein